MPIPKRITPDRIVDALVEIRYSSAFPFEVIIGSMYHGLDETYNYTSRPNTGNFEPVPSEIPFDVAGKYFFYNDVIRIQALPNSIIFNCNKHYPLWDTYFYEIKKALEQISSYNVFTYFNRVSMRYISQYPDLELKNISIFKNEFSLPNTKLNRSSINSQLEYKDKRVVINLHDRVIPPKNIESLKDSAFVSQIDIDILNEVSIEGSDFESLYKEIDLTHKYEKEVFFEILDQNYLATLNPEYDETT